MYFVNENHKDNYFVLMGMYGLIPGQDSEYEAAIYIAAYPEIFKAYNIDILKDQVRGERLGPLYYLTFDDLHLEHNPKLLTGTTWTLCDIGNSLFNGYHIGLDDVFGSIGSNREALNIFLEACDIRTYGNLKGAMKNLLHI